MAFNHSGKKRYNILMIAPTSFWFGYGGHVRILEEATILQKMGHKVTIATYHSGQDVEGLDIRRTLPIPWRRGYEVGTSRHRMVFDALLALKALQVAWRLKPDIIHAHMHEGAFIGYPISRLLGIPLVFDFQGSLTGEMVDHHFLNPHGPLYRPVRWLERLIDHLPGTILTSSIHAAQLLTNDFDCPPERVHSIPDCVNADAFRPPWDGGPQQAEIEALKAHLGIPLHRKVVVYLGLLADYQGTDLLLEAAARLIEQDPEVHFLIMGFPSVDYYYLKARELGLRWNATLPGKIPYAEAPRYLALGHVAVSTKLSATEGCGKILNYMAMGLPTVAFDTPVSREYLGELGVYAELGNPVALAEAIASLLGDEEKAVDLGRKLRERAVREYSWEMAGERILAIYDQAWGR